MSHTKVLLIVYVPCTMASSMDGDGPKSARPIAILNDGPDPNESEQHSGITRANAQV